MALTVADLSEQLLLDRIVPRLVFPCLVVPFLGQATDVSDPSGVVGAGDDAAVIPTADGRCVLSIDTLVQDRDFRMSWPNGYRTAGFDVGWKSAAQNLSDINAMGARATSLVVSLTLPGATEVAWVEDLADGLAAAIDGLGATGCRVVGGDLSGGGEIVVTAAVTGSLEGRQPVLRSGAQPGDVVALAGTLGRAAAGWALLESRHGVGSLEAELLDLVHCQLRPRPPLHAGPAAAASGASAMLDISDGLARDANRLATASGVAIELDPDAVRHFAEPLLGAADLLGRDAAEWVLGGGEDHGLLAAFGRTVTLPEGFTAVGSVKAGVTGVTVGSQSPGTVGWDHFAD